MEPQGVRSSGELVFFQRNSSTPSAACVAAAICAASARERDTRDVSCLETHARMPHNSEARFGAERARPRRCRWSAWSSKKKVFAKSGILFCQFAGWVDSTPRVIRNQRATGRLPGCEQSCQLVRDVVELTQQIVGLSLSSIGKSRNRALPALSRSLVVLKFGT